jgi:putative Ca2+/H+ antiporter (TMEM165/GDT1 family)
MVCAFFIHFYRFPKKEETTMALFLQIMLTVFIAEMGDKTQLMMIAMTSRFKVRDIILGAGAAILVLNALAVGVGALVSSLIPPYVIKIAAALAFFYFAWSSLKDEGDEEENTAQKDSKLPVLAVFGTFFLAELGDKTQLTAIAFAANEGLSQALLVWAACSVGLFAADVIGMLVGYLLKSKMPEGFLNLLAMVIFAVFGVVTMLEGAQLLLGENPVAIVVTVVVTALFLAACVVTWRKQKKGGGTPDAN